ncbi:MAG: HNH endonuclease [Cetobacterium sp.]
MDNICKSCGEKFIAKRKNKEYCSIYCKNNKYKNIELICEQCENKFIGNKGAKYCSKICKSIAIEYRLKEHKCICKACGNEFFSKRESAKYCSRKCRESRHINICQYCNSEFKGKENQKFCCLDCANNHFIDKASEDYLLKVNKELNSKSTPLKIINIHKLESGDNRDNIFTVKCLNCGKTHTVTGGSITYKNKKCYNGCQHCNGKYKIKCCHTCGSNIDNIIYKTSQYNFCSEECLDKYKYKTCSKCNKKFSINNSKSDLCKECRHEYAKVLKKEKCKENFKSENKICKFCGKQFNTEYKKSKIYCSDECIRKNKNLQSKKYEGKRGNRIRINGEVDNDISLHILFKKHKGICSICNNKCNYKDCITDENGNFIAGDMYPSIDHTIPISKGGTHTWDNVQLAHRICNSYKCDSI